MYCAEQSKIPRLRAEQALTSLPLELIHTILTRLFNDILDQALEACIRFCERAMAELCCVFRMSTCMQWAPIATVSCHFSNPFWTG